jgi:hypothetical protein
MLSGARTCLVSKSELTLGVSDWAEDDDALLVLGSELFRFNKTGEKAEGFPAVEVA